MEKFRSIGFFILAMVYFLFAVVLAGSAARGLTSGEARELLSRSILLFILLAGYAGMGYAFQLQREPLKAMGLWTRPGWQREFGLGVALGWGSILACVLPIVLFGSLVLTLWSTPRQYGLLLLNALTLAVAALGEEVVFRGYPFQRLIEAIGPTTATILMGVIFGVVHLQNPHATSASTLVTVLSGVLLGVAYLQTRALWLPWGFHFGWNVMMALLFGLPVSGLNFSAVVESHPVGPSWLTGGSYGPEGSLIAVAVLVIGLIVLVRITRGYAWKYAQPVIIAGGIPVDLDRAQSRVHEAAQVNAGEATPARLVQIAGATSISPVAMPEANATQPASAAMPKVEAELPQETEPPL